MRDPGHGRPYWSVARRCTGVCPIAPTELSKGLLALAFGSDMRMGVVSQHIRRFVRLIRFFIAHRGSVDRKAEYRAVVEEFARRIPEHAKDLCQFDRLVFVEA